METERARLEQDAEDRRAQLRQLTERLRRVREGARARTHSERVRSCFSISSIPPNLRLESQRRAKGSFASKRDAAPWTRSSPRSRIPRMPGLRSSTRWPSSTNSGPPHCLRTRTSPYPSARRFARPNVLDDRLDSRRACEADAAARSARTRTEAISLALSGILECVGIRDNAHTAPTDRSPLVDCFARRALPYRLAERRDPRSRPSRPHLRPQLTTLPRSSTYGTCEGSIAR